MKQVKLFFPKHKLGDMRRAAKAIISAGKIKDPEVDCVAGVIDSLGVMFIQASTYEALSVAICYALMKLEKQKPKNAKWPKPSSPLGLVNEDYYDKHPELKRPK